MRNLKLHILFTFVVLFASTYITNAQIGNKKVLLRDSLDYQSVPLAINSKNNEFSPIPYKGGLIYVSDKKNNNSIISFNKIYWVADSNLGKVDSTKVSKIKPIIKPNDDFTPITSNDNNILYFHKKQKTKSSNKIEAEFSDFTTDQAFAYNDLTHLLVYAKMSTKKIAGSTHWELWQANFSNGKLKHNKRLLFDDILADYLYPFLNDSATRLYFSSNKKDGQGGYDLYYVNKLGDGWESKPIPVNNANSASDEISASIINDTLYYSSNRPGGLGGFDIYAQLYATSSKIENLGYPINSINDEIGLKKINEKYYLTTNRNGNFDIVSLAYKPVFYPIAASLKYAVDGTIASHQKLIVKDIDAGINLDTISTDDFSNIRFTAKPNRNYELSTLDGDGFKQIISLTTNDKQPNTSLVLNLPGRSPKQVRDSIQLAWAKIESAKKDSIAKFTLADKFVVRYNFNKTSIHPKEQIVLDSLLNKLQNLPNVYVVIGSFTDCIGSYKNNYKVSLKRGKSVVNYLTSHGLARNRIVATGYAKKYTLSPCTTKYNTNSKQLQSNSRRAEIVLSESKNTDWASLEKQRTANYYAVFSSNNSLLPKTLVVVKPIIKKDTAVVVKATTMVVKKDTVAKVVVKPIFKKDSVVIAKVIPTTVKKDTIAKAVARSIVKKDTTVVVKASPIVVKNDTIAKVIAKPIIKKDSVVIAKVIPTTVKKDTIAKAVVKSIVKKDTTVVAKATPVVAKKDTVAKLVAKPIIKKDSVVIAKVIPTTVKKDTIAKAVAKSIVKKDTAIVVKTTPIVVKKDTIGKVVTKSIIKKDTLIVAKVKTALKKQKDSIKVSAPAVIIAKSTSLTPEDDDQMSKEEIIKALDSLAKLKREQERIVEYLTKRINKKPIDVYVSSDSVTIELYDNGIHDKDSVSVIYNNRLVVDRQELKVNQPIKFKLKVDKNKKNNELVLVAENLGTEPPNTGVMFITEKSGRRQQVVLSTDMTHNEVVYFIRIGKE